MADDIKFSDFGVSVEIFDSVWKAILSQGNYLELDSTKLPFIRNRDQIQPKLVEGENITIDAETNVISASLQDVNIGIETVNNKRFLSILLVLKLATQLVRSFSVAYKVCAQYRGTQTQNPYNWQACTMFLQPNVLTIEDGVWGNFPFLQFSGYKVSFYPGYGSKIDLYDVDGYPTDAAVDIIFPSAVSWYKGIESDWESVQFDSSMDVPENWAGRCALFALEPLPTTGIAVVGGVMYNTVSLRDAFNLFKGIGVGSLGAFIRFTGMVSVQGDFINPLESDQICQLNLNSGADLTQIIWNSDGESLSKLNIHTLIGSVDNIVLLSDGGGNQLSDPATLIPISINSSDGWWWGSSETQLNSLPELFLDKWEILF